MRWYWAIVMTGAVFAAACTVGNKPAPLAVTYIANTGFLIECADRKILVDALFGGFAEDWCFVPPDSVIDLMTAGKPPFNDIDIIGVTHAHTDHFNPRLVMDHLVHNRRGILVCPAQAAQKLETDPRYSDVKDRIRIMPMPTDSISELTISGIGVKAFKTPHLHAADAHRDIEHLEYLFTVGGRTIFHTGDSGLNDIRRYEGYGFGQKPIDLAFVCWWNGGEPLTFQRKLIRDILRPERIIMMHMAPHRPPAGHPEQEQTVAHEVFVPQYCLQRWGPWPTR